jgi:hypothetical protein
MAIPESQLRTWSHQGSVQQSSATYQTIRNALLVKESGYADKSFDVFLQGSYRNDTNIYSESDVDVVICLNSTFRYETQHLSAMERHAYGTYVGPVAYNIDQFKADVISCLRRSFGAANVAIGNKAIKIKGSQSRRDADVVVCYEYRHYNSFSLSCTSDYISGIVFPTPYGEIINYPKQHSANLTDQHQATNNTLKPMVRILKNMRSRMVSSGELAEGVAPSYYIEGLFYNVPPNQYISSSFGDTFCNGINWLLQADRAKLVCANWQYYLLGDANVQWRSTDLEVFLSAACKLWKSSQY